MLDPDSTSDANSSRAAKPASKSLLDRLLSLVRREPEDRESIKVLLDAAHQRQLLDAESYAMIKGALAVSERTVGDIMVPRSRMDLLDIAQPLPDLLPIIIETAHSRFPVFEGDRDNIIGILLAKDLLRCMLIPEIALRVLIRPAVFIPESKRLNVLLHDFRESRNHLAIVIDEHGGIAGLVSMEDVLEEIVGDIEDEFDEDEASTIFTEGDHQWRVQATTDIDKFNETFSTSLPEHEYDTVGGWLGSELGHIPRRGDTLERHGLRIEVIRADPRRALWLRVQRPTAPLALPTSTSDDSL
jgi:magnesium and cobalt transporter